MRAHACVAEDPKSDEIVYALSRPCVVFGCKIHAVTDALGLPVRLILTGAQAVGITQATPSCKGLPPRRCWLKDRATKQIPAEAGRLES